MDSSPYFRPSNSGTRYGRLATARSAMSTSLPAWTVVEVALPCCLLHTLLVLLNLLPSMCLCCLQDMSE